MLIKTCTKCNTEYPATAEYFYRCNSSKDGLRSICKICDKKKWAEGAQKKQEIEQQKQQNTLKDRKARGVKFCPKCKQELPANLDYFYSNVSNEDGLSYWCKDCSKQVMKVWKSKNYNQIIEKQRARYKANMQNPDFVNKQKQYDKEYYQNHKENKLKYLKQYTKEYKNKIKAYNKEYSIKNRSKIRETSRAYYQEHKEEIKEKQKLYYQKHKEEMKLKNRLRHHNNKFKRNFSTAISYALKGAKSERHWEDLVSYNLQQLKEYIEAQFIPPMSWDNYGTYWELDHIIPQNLFHFTTPEDIDFKICWSLANLRPLTVYENRSRPKDGSDISDDIRQKILKGVNKL